MIKKRHVFYIIYVLVLLGCMVASLVLTPITPRTSGTPLRSYNLHPSVEGDIMLMITAILLAIAVLYLIVRKIYISRKK